MAIRQETAEMRANTPPPWDKVNGPLGPSSNFASMGYTCPRCKCLLHESTVPYHSRVRCLARIKRGYKW